MKVAGPINAAMRDTVVIWDTMPVLRQKVEMITPHIHLTGLIEEGAERRNPRAGNAPAGREGRIQRLGILETGEVRAPDRFERQSLCGNQLLRIYQN